MSPPGSEGDHQDRAMDEPCVLCRCEEVSVAEIDAAIAAGARTINDVKRQTRAGMGLCQGTFCVAEMLRRLPSLPENGTVTPMTARPPVRLITLGELAALSATPEDTDSNRDRSVSIDTIDT